MIFSTIEDEAKLSGHRITNIFSQTAASIRSALQSTQGITFSTGFSTQLNQDTVAVRNYIAALNSGVPAEQAFANTMREASVEAQTYVQSVNQATLSVENFERHQRMSGVTVLAQNKSLGNVKTLLNEYNSSLGATANGITSCGLKQADFVNSVSQSNSVLGKYLSGLNGTNASMKGYVGTLIASKAATIGLQIATTALNAVISFGIGVLVSAAISGLQQIIHYEENLIEKSEEAADKISELSDAFKTNSQTVNDISKRFAELSKGVDSLTGKNMSLTTDEYQEFLDISNQLANIFPTLSRKYDENGNAIVDLSGDVDTVVGSLNQLLEVERQITNLKIAENLPDLYKGVFIKSQNYNDDIEYYSDRLSTLSDSYNTIISDEFANSFDDILTNDVLNIKSNGESLEEFCNITDDYLKVLDELGYKYEYLSSDYETNPDTLVEEPIGHYYRITDFANMTEEEIEEAKEKIKVGIQGLAETYNNEIKDLNNKISTKKNENKANWSSLLSSISAWLSTESSYQILNDDMQAVVQSMINNIDFNALNFKKWEDVEEYIQTNIISKIQNASEETKQAFSELFTMRFDGKSTVGEIKAKAQEIADDSDFTYDEIIKAVGFDDSKVTALRDKFSKSSWFADANWSIAEPRLNDFNEWIDSLTPDELAILYDVIVNTDTADYTLQDWKDALENSPAYINIVFGDYTNEVNKLISEISSIQDVVSSQTTGKSISVEDFSSEELAAYTSALEYHNGVLQLNADKVREIVEAKAEETIATNDANKALAQTNYLRNASEIEKLRQKIKDKNYAEGESEETIQANIDALLEENSTLKNQCDTYDLMSASLREATSAYSNWLNAQNASQSGDMFDDTLNAINRINETLNNTDSDFFGRTGRTDYKAAIGLIIPESIDQEDTEKVNAYLKSVYDLFTYDDDGNYAGLNIANFCQKAVDAGLMVLDESGENYQIAGSKTMEDFAEGLNLSLPLVQAMFGEMEEFGGEFSWADEANKTIGDLAVSANVAAENLRGLHSDMTITLDVSDLTTAKEKSDALDSTIKQMQDLKTKVGVDSEEVEYANSIISYCITQKQQLSEPAILDVDVSKVSETTGEAVLLIQDFQKACNDLELKKALGLDTTDAQAKVDELYSQITSSDNDALLALKLDTTSVETVKSSIAGLTIDDIKTKLQIDDTALLSYQPEDKQATVTYDVDTTKVDNYNPKNLSRTVTYYVRTVGSVKANGTANLTGTAKAGGDWGTAQGGQTLTGELGREIVVDPRTGRWYTVGDTGAEFVNIPRGAIVFNHKQTESLLKNGYVAGRASALVGGTAMVTGGIGVGNANNSTTSGGNSTSNYGKTSNSSSNKSSSSDDDKIEAFDWIEIAIDRIERAIDRLKKTAESTYKALKTKLGATADEITKVNQEIALQQQAYNRYMQEANSVGLDAGLAEKVRNGTIDINQYDEDTRNLISDYQKWYEAALDCSEAIDDLHENLASLYEDNFNNTQEDFENQLALAEHLTNQYENGIDLLEARGYLESTKYYSAMQDATKGNIAILNNELAALEQSFSDAMNSGEIEYGSAAWYEMQIAINGVKEEIAEANVELAEYAKTMREIEWGYFDYTQERISQLTQEADFLIDLMSNSDLHTDKGQLTDEGMATMGLHGQNYNTYMAQADMYAQEILEIDKELAKDPYNTELIERREELLGLQQDSILAAEDEKQAIVALVEEGINLELQAMQDLIDKYTESLDTAKD